MKRLALMLALLASLIVASQASATNYTAHGTIRTAAQTGCVVNCTIVIQVREWYWPSPAHPGSWHLFEQKATYPNPPGNWYDSLGYCGALCTDHGWDFMFYGRQGTATASCYNFSSPKYRTMVYSAWDIDWDLGIQTVDQRACSTTKAGALDSILAMNASLAP